MKIRQKDKENFVLFCLLLFFITMAIASVIWNSNNYYSNAYKPMVDDANARHTREGRNERSAEKRHSVEPRAHGFRESEIEKKRGDRFSTY